ncbi:MAG: hypothetical protein H7Z40_04390 [Phycisphaerae bacterium]|nr:hypothetical protein [Gemmatimonadaceae bacterium]
MPARRTLIRTIPPHFKHVGAASVAHPLSNVLRRVLYLLAASALSLATVRPALAQERMSAAGEEPAHAFTLNPFFVLAGWISGEYEHRLNSSLTLGAGASYVDFSDQRYSSFEMKARLYPNERAMRGFEMGLGLGVTAVDTDTDDNDCNKGPCGATEKTTVTTPTVSLEFGHQWNLGDNRRTILALGGGGKRFLASKKDLNDTPRVIPFFRIAIGYGW